MEREKFLQAMDFLKDWSAWRGSLNEAMIASRKFGVSDQKIKEISEKMQEFLTQKVCPATREEELLKDMWNAARPEERKTIASLFFKLAE
jgi:sulfur relay (sulfurtransferase) DsrC/TusE family protein